MEKLPAIEWVIGQPRDGQKIALKTVYRTSLLHQVTAPYCTSLLH
jgi:hypothetical protein